MKAHATHQRKRKRTAWTALACSAAVALLALSPAARAHDDHDEDDWYGDRDDYGRYDDSRYYDGEYYLDDLHGFGSRPYYGPYPAEVVRFEFLHGYGHWRWVPRLRAHLWFPFVEASWRPYVYGHWIHTSHGMTWVSYEPWGEIPHHYGRWVYVDHAGWGWVPGYTYAPAWVTWAVVDGCVGWAPLPPAGYRYPRYHRYHLTAYPVDYGYGGTFVYHDSGLDFRFWIFVSDRDFYGTSVHRHILPVEHTLSLFKKKKVLPVGRSLHFDYAQKISKNKIRTVKTGLKKKRAGDRWLVLHEPHGQREKVRAGREAVKRVVTHEKVRAGRSVAKPDIARDRIRKEKTVVKREVTGEKSREVAAAGKVRAADERARPGASKGEDRELKKESRKEESRDRSRGAPQKRAGERKTEKSKKSKQHEKDDKENKKKGRSG
jgi:hypothetical protein